MHSCIANGAQKQQKGNEKEAGRAEGEKLEGIEESNNNNFSIK